MLVTFVQESRRTDSKVSTKKTPKKLEIERLVLLIDVLFYFLSLKNSNSFTFKDSICLEWLTNLDDKCSNFSQFSPTRKMKIEHPILKIDIFFYFPSLKK